MGMLPVFDLYSDQFDKINLQKKSHKELIRVFFNLYKFMLKLRLSIRNRVNDPHMYTMKHLKRCIVNTFKANQTGVDNYLDDCNLEYNELTEVYYFMKYFLAINDIHNAGKLLLDDQITDQNGKV